MENVVKLLPESVSSCIAAGEVVLRPASVVKEMLENAIDAGASSVRIILTDAGRTAIQIIDNGVGMSVTDALVAFQRHATSKISTPEDLYSLSTFGFRGEALASIAAVSEVQLRTRREEDEVGTCVTIHGGDAPSQEPVSCPKGCDFTVKNLFFNLPARRKFLKSNQTELSNIMKEVERIAIVHPEVAVSVFHQNSEILSLPSVNSVKQRISAIFGNGINKSLIPVSTETSAVSVSGYVSNFDGVKKKGAEQFFFVNGRYMRHPYFHKAVLEPYENMVPASEQPSYFLFLTVPADSIDVNIHPTKTEIKFEEEQLVWKILNAAVREAVGRYEGTTSIDFDTEGMPDIPIMSDSSAQVRQPKVSYNPAYNPFNSVSEKSRGNGNGDWTKLFGGVLDSRLKEASQDYETAFDNAGALEKASEAAPCFQYGGYIVTRSDKGVMIVDQHRAHVAILYDRYQSQQRSGESVSQGLLFPEIMQLSPSDSALLADCEEDLISFGFDLSDMGHGAVAIQGVPSDLEGKDYNSLLVELLHSVADGAQEVSEKRREKMAISMARAAAVSSTKLMSLAEMQDMIGALIQCGLPKRTPEGKVIYVIMDDSELSSHF